MSRLTRHIFPVLLLITALLSLASCVGVNNLRKMTLRSGRIVDVKMPSFETRVIDFSLLVEIENPAGYVKMSDISGVIRSKDMTVGSFTAEDFSIDAHSDKEYVFRACLTPDEKLSFFRILTLLNEFSPADYVFDIDLRLSGDPRSKGARYHLKDQPLGMLLKNFHQ